jgi:monovalent cation:H+ antiporter, CPA1 family
LHPSPVLQGSEPGVVQIEIVLIVGLLIITGIAMLVRRFRFPYTVALVIAGLILAIFPALFPFNFGFDKNLISSDVILEIFVPPLVFEGALKVDWRRLQANLLPVLLMAVVGVVLGTFIIGGAVMSIASSIGWLSASSGLGMLDSYPAIPFLAALAFGALISSTDPVAVIAFFRKLGVEKRLGILVEGESLLNDGTAIVIFNLALAAGGVMLVHTGSETSSQVNLTGAIGEFFKVSIGGLFIGLVIGKLAEMLFRRTDNRLVETTITIPVAFGAYVVAEQFGLSGILSVVAAGIYLGTVIPAHTSPTTKIALYNFWEVLSFIVTSLIFLIIGWMIDIRQLISPQNLVIVLAAVVAVVAARALVVYGISALTNYGLSPLGNRWKSFKVVPIPAKYQHVMFWGGMRGAISLALALSLSPDAFGPQVGERLRMMTFAVVLFTIIVQGTTIEKLIKKLGLATRSRSQLEKERYLGRYYIARAAQEELNRLHESGVISGSLWKAMEEAQLAELTEHDRAVRDLLHRFPEMSNELALQARRSILLAERTALDEASRNDVISEEIHEMMLEELDLRIKTLEMIAQQEATSLFIDEDDIGLEQ